MKKIFLLIKTEIAQIIEIPFAEFVDIIANSDEMAFYKQLPNVAYCDKLLTCSHADGEAKATM